MSEHYNLPALKELQTTSEFRSKDPLDLKPFHSSKILLVVFFTAELRGF